MRLGTRSVHSGIEYRIQQNSVITDDLDGELAVAQAFVDGVQRLHQHPWAIHSVENAVREKLQDWTRTKRGPYGEVDVVQVLLDAMK